MSSIGALNELHNVFDASTAIPLTDNFANEPTYLRYHRFFDMDSQNKTRHEIFVPPGKEQEILNLDANKEWAKLRDFPPFSDAPLPDEMRPNAMGLPQADGTYKYFYVPDEDAKRARADELMRAKDYKTLEEEFEPWNNQPYDQARKDEEWARGMVRCAEAREAAKQHAERASA